MRLRLLAHCPSLPRPLAWSPPAHDALGEQRQLHAGGTAKGRGGQPEVSALYARFTAAQRKQRSDVVCKHAFALHADAKTGVIQLPTPQRPNGSCTGPQRIIISPPKSGKMP